MTDAIRTDDIPVDDTPADDATGWPVSARLASTISAIVHVVLGVGAFCVTATWFWTAAFGNSPAVEAMPDFSTAPTVAAGSTSAPTSVSGRVSEAPIVDDSAMALSVLPTGAAPDAAVEAVTVTAAHQSIDATDRTVTDVGCSADLSAGGLHSFFSERMGPLVGWDNPHVYPVGDGRTIWILHDSYVDYDRTAASLRDTRPQMQNVMLLQQGRCFHLIHGGTDTDWHNFEIGDGHDTNKKFLWPLGGEVVGDKLWVFWSETVLSSNPPLPGGGARRHPTGTWLASYDVDTLERLSFEPAPNSGVEPQYGFAVSSDVEYSYLFGNTNQLNLIREGGFENGPHSATRMYVARVPHGEFTTSPQYWDGDDWSADAASAVTISERFWTENTMQPKYLNGQWVSVVKRDGFFGNEVIIDVAPAAQGPWVEVERIRYETRESDVAKNSYQPIIAPWSGPDVGLMIIIAENAQDWEHAVDRLDEYRPAVFTLDWPEPPSAMQLATDGGVSAAGEG